MPAILIECVFVDSSSDMSNYNTEKMANAIFNGVCKSFGISVSNLDIGAANGESDGASSNFYHTVVSGDTLWNISKKYEISVDKLVEISDIKDRNLIHIGQRIKVR